MKKHYISSLALIVAGGFVASSLFGTGSSEKAIAFNNQEGQTEKTTLEENKVLEPIEKVDQIFPGIKNEIVKTISISDNMTLFIMNQGQNLFYEHQSNTVIHSLSRKGMSLYNIGENGVQDYLDIIRKPFHADIIKNELFDPIVYKSPVEVEKIKVFVDPLCGFCHQMHSEIQSYLDNGFTVEYYPLIIFRERSENIFFSIWSIDDPELRKSEFDRVFKEISKRKPNAQYTIEELGLPQITEKGLIAVKNNKSAGNKMGIHSTPAIALKNGLVLPGYFQASELKNLLNKIN